MEVIEIRLDKIKPYPKNAKTHPEEQVEMIANSIKEFGFRTPLVIDENFVIVQGHGRRLASISLGLKTVPCVIADDLSAQQIEMLRLADNKVAESDWDDEMLVAELDALKDVFDLDAFGFDLDVIMDEMDDLDDDIYTSKIVAPTYEPSEDIPEIETLFNDDRYKKLIHRIDNADISEEVKDFLKVSATRHIVFDFSNIGDYYSHADEVVQNLMEASALVIIDFERAIEEGYVVLSDAISGQYSLDEEDKEAEDAKTD